MKKIFFIVLIACGASNTMSAQQTDTTKLIINARTSLGIKIGFTQAQLRGSQMDSLSSDGSSSPILGFHIGITANSMLGKYFWLKHELIATQKGAHIVKSDTINGRYNTTLKTLSLDLFPVSPTFHYKGFQFYAGPYLSVLLDANIRRKNGAGQFVNDDGIFGSGRNFQRQSKYMQKFDYGLSMGVEYEFPCGLNIGAKYVRGFAELLDWANSITIGKPTDDTKIRIYTEYFNVSVGYNFMKGKNK